MSKEERDMLKKMIYDYGNEGILRELISVVRENANDQSDWSQKDKAIDSLELADMLSDVLYAFVE